MSEEQIENGGEQKATESVEVEFTNSAAEQLYNSCIDIQKNISFDLDMEMQLAFFIGKLRKWTNAYIESKTKFAKSLGFIVNGNQFTQSMKWDESKREENLEKLSNQFSEVSQQQFTHWDELKEMIPLSKFTEKSMKENKIPEKTDKQFFLEYCIKQTKP